MAKQKTKGSGGRGPEDFKEMKFGEQTFEQIVEDFFGDGTCLTS